MLTSFTLVLSMFPTSALAQESLPPGWGQDPPPVADAPAPPPSAEPSAELPSGWTAPQPDTSSASAGSPSAPAAAGVDSEARSAVTAALARTLRWFEAFTLPLPSSRTPAARAANDLTISDHEGQLKVAGVPGAYSNGNITEYAEKETIDFRFDLDASAAGSGTVEIEFSGNVGGGSGCTPFFNQTFALGTIESVAGAVPTVAAVGTPSADGNDWSQVLSVIFAGSGSARVNYTLTLSDVAGDCGGSSQHSRIGTTTGDFANAGAQNVPIPAKDILELPDITVIKNIDRDGDGIFEDTAAAGEYCFSLDGGACVPTDGSGQVVFTGVVTTVANTDPADPHNHAITEQQLDFGTGTYTFVSGSGTNCVFNGATATATVQADNNSPQNSTCEFNNGVVKGTIIVEKQTDPDGAPGTFTFTGDVAGSISDDGTLTVTDLVPGTYTSTESDPTVTPGGFDLTDITCDDGNSSGDTGTRTATFVLDPGETVTCVFTNTKDGKIVVEKQTLPNADPTQFTFAGDVAGVIGDGGQLMVSVAPGRYTSTETVPGGWSLAGIVCDDANSSGDLNSATATFNVEPGETVTCVFTDTNLPTIIVEKQTLPDGDPAQFDFAGDVAGTTIGDGGSLFVVVQPGQYQATETVPAGWSLTSIVCNDNDSTGNTGTATATFNVGPGEVVTCVFTNAKDGNIVVEKQTLPDGDPTQFTFAGDVAGNLSDGQSRGTSVAPGTYTSTETVPGGWRLAGIACDDLNSSGDLNSATATFNVEPGETVTCVFTNTNLPAIIVEKQTDPDGATQAFTFTPSWGAAFELSDGQSNDSGPLAPGQYSVIEATTGDWSLTSSTCSDQSLPSAIDLGPGETVTCTFNNKDLLPSITVDKTAISTLVAPGGLVTFTVKVTNTSSQGDPVTLTSLTDDIYGDLTAPANTGISNSTCALVTIQPGTSYTCTFQAQVSGIAAAIEKDTVTASGTDDEGHPTSSNDDHSIALTPVIDLEVTTLFNPTDIVLDTNPAIGPNEQTVLTVTVVNNGPSAATDVVVLVTVPADLTYLSDSCSAPQAGAVGSVCTFDPATGVLTLGTVGVGESAILQITLGVTTAGASTSVAEVIQANEPDVDSTPNNHIPDEDDQDPAVLNVTQVLASSTIGDFVWNDLDLDGKQDPGEPGISGVTVKLTDLTTPATVTRVTDVNGQYLFAGLPIGSFQVQVLSGVPADLSATTPAIVAVILTTDGESFLDADFGFGKETLPKTGSDTDRLLPLGLLLLLLGMFLVLATRRPYRALMAARNGSSGHLTAGVSGTYRRPLQP